MALLLKGIRPFHARQLDVASLERRGISSINLHRTIKSARMALSDAEEEDLKAAIALSLSQGETNRTQSMRPDATTKSPTGKPSVQSAGIFGLNRKEMEEERLARLSGKRERSVSPPPLKSSRKAPKLEANTTVLPSGALLRSFSTLVNTDQHNRKPEAANAANRKLKSPAPRTALKEEPVDHVALSSSTSTQGTLKYPNGVVKKTWASGFDRSGQDTRLEEVLEPLTLRTAVLSAFQWDSNWVLEKLKTPPKGKTKCIFVMQAKEETQKQEMLATVEEASSWLRLCFPPMDGLVHCMHSKLMLLFHPEKLRVAIPTANLLDFDWGETGVMENSVFVIDLPRLPDGIKCELGHLTPFAVEMLHYLTLQGVGQDVRDGVRNFDFSATQGMAFVHTAGGVHYGENMRRTGLTGLARAVRELNLQTDDNLEIDFAASSIGSLNDELLEKFHAAARGIDIIERERESKSQAKANFFKPATSPKKSGSELSTVREKIRIYFPTFETVTSSIAGAAGTICLNRNWFEKPTFPRSCFRDYRSTRTGLLSHNKILYARGSRMQPDGSKKQIAWAYIGSSNMSESAWGKMSYDAKKKEWKIGCRNWECGVLLPVQEEKIEAWEKAQDGVAVKEDEDGDDSETEIDGSETESEDGGTTTNGKNMPKTMVGMEVFDGIVKPPFKMPGHKYEGREPWYFTERGSYASRLVSSV